jgi:hypothetical protein
MTIYPDEAGRRPRLEIVSGSMPDRHLMIDIETYDTEITAVILSIGAVVFNPRGETLGDEFHIKLSTASQSDRTTSDATVAWWMQQDADAREATFGGKKIPIGIALMAFTNFINRLKPTCTRVWAKSPDFDCSILNHACKQQNIRWPFKFWESRCCRTIIDLAYPMGDFPHMEVEGPKHDALADAKRQAKEVQHAYHVLKA